MEKNWRGISRTSLAADCKAWRRQHYDLGLLYLVRSREFSQNHWHINGKYVYVYDILHENLETLLLQVGLEDNFVFQQDNNPKHTAKITQTFFKSSRMKVLDWPPQSSDLNPIENLWSILDKKIDKTGVTNTENYFVAIKEAWEELDEKYLQNLVESMPKRLQAVIKAKGSQILILVFFHFL